MLDEFHEEDKPYNYLPLFDENGWTSRAHDIHLKFSLTLTRLFNDYCIEYGYEPRHLYYIAQAACYDVHLEQVLEHKFKSKSA